MKQYRNILVIKSGALGDLIAGTTALRALRAGLPDAKLTMLSNAAMAEISPPGTLLDDIVPFDHVHANPAGYFSTLKELRGRKFDLAVNLRWASEGSALLAFLSGAGERAGSGPKGSRWMYTVAAPWHEGRRHEFVRHLDIVGALGIPVSAPEPFVYYTDADRAFASSLLGSDGPDTLLIHPGASTRSKCWPAGRFAELGKMFLRTTTARIIVTRGPGEDALAGELVAAIGGGARLAPQTTIARLAALIAQCRICVCNYSGVMNVAMAVKTPLVAIGCTSPLDWGPYGEIHRTVNAEIQDDSFTDAEREAAMSSIGVEPVWRVLSERWRELAGTASPVKA